MSVGIKESKEVVVAGLDLLCELLKVFKDGVQPTDALVLYSDLIKNEDFKAKFIAAYESVKLVPEEVKDIDIAEASELGILMLSYLPKFIEALKKQ